MSIKTPYITLNGKKITYSDASPQEKARAAWEAGRETYGIKETTPQQFAAAVAHSTAARLGGGTTAGGKAVYSRVESGILGEMGLRTPREEAVSIAELETQATAAQLEEAKRLQKEADAQAKKIIAEQKSKASQLLSRSIRGGDLGLSPIPTTEVYERERLKTVKPDLADIFRHEERLLALRSQEIMGKAARLQVRADLPFYTSEGLEKFEKERLKLEKEASELEADAAGYVTTATQQIVKEEARLKELFLTPAGKAEAYGLQAGESFTKFFEQAPLLKDIKGASEAYERSVAAHKPKSFLLGLPYEAATKLGSVGLGAAMLPETILRGAWSVGAAARFAADEPTAFPEVLGLGLGRTGKQFAGIPPVVVGLSRVEKWGTLDIAKPADREKFVSEFKTDITFGVGVGAAVAGGYAIVKGVGYTAPKVAALVGTAKAKVLTLKPPALTPDPLGLPKGAKVLSVKQATALEKIPRAQPLWKGDAVSRKVYVPDTFEVKYLAKGASKPTTKLVTSFKAPAGVVPKPEPVGLVDVVVPKQARITGVKLETGKLGEATLKLKKIDAGVADKSVFKIDVSGKQLKILSRETEAFQQVRARGFDPLTKKTTVIDRVLFKGVEPVQWVEAFQRKGLRYEAKLGWGEGGRLEAIAATKPAEGKAFTAYGVVETGTEKIPSLVYKFKKPPEPTQFFKPASIKKTPYDYPVSSSGGTQQILKTKTIPKSLQHVGGKAITVSVTDLKKLGSPAVKQEVVRDAWGKPIGVIVVDDAWEDVSGSSIPSFASISPPKQVQLPHETGVFGLTSLGKTTPIQRGDRDTFRLVTPTGTSLSLVSASKTIQLTQSISGISKPAPKQISVPKTAVGRLNITALGFFSAMKPAYKTKTRATTLPKFGVTQPVVTSPEITTPPLTPTPPVPPAFYRFPRVTKKKKRRVIRRKKTSYGVEHIPIPTLPLPFIGALEIKGLTPLSYKPTQKDLSEFKWELKLSPAFAGESLAMKIKKRSW